MVEGEILTINAMVRRGCQCAIVQKIVDQEAGYAFRPKGNQDSLRENVELFVAQQKAGDLMDTVISRAETAELIMAASKPASPPSSTTSTGYESSVRGRA